MVTCISILTYQFGRFSERCKSVLERYHIDVQFLRFTVDVENAANVTFQKLFSFAFRQPT